MLAGLFPRTCSALSVFVSYSHEQRPLAEEIAQALKNAGHEVFFDRDSIPGAGDYNERIREAVNDSDRFVFLASRESLTPGKFALTELQFAKERWTSPADRVFTVIVDRAMKPADLPAYLRSVSVIEPMGSTAAELVAAIHKTRRVGTLCKAVTALGMFAAMGSAAAAYLGMPFGGRPTEVVLMAPQKIHFRSQVEAPTRPNAPQASTDWVGSPMTVTVMPVAFTHRTEPGRRARVQKETVDLEIDGKVDAYRALYHVEITDQMCGERWFCIKANAGPETLEPGRSISRETLFIPVERQSWSWARFIDAVLTKPELSVKVAYKADVEVSEASGIVTRKLTSRCRIDTKQMRKDLEQAGFKAGATSRPVFLEPDCILE